MADEKIEFHGLSLILYRRPDKVDEISACVGWFRLDGTKVTHVHESRKKGTERRQCGGIGPSGT